jgi:cystathionine beta-lyase/cystathionine gamma-synthase
MSNLIIDSKTKIYLRYTNNQNELLKQKLSNYYNQSNITIANSGLHANYLALESIFKLNNISNIIYQSELYHESINLIRSLNTNLYQINTNTETDIIELFKSKDIYMQSNILFIESCTNPNGYIFNYELIPILRSLCTKLYIICDNSWLSNVIFNPFDYQIDIVTISLTKYYSGGNAICGACIISDKNNDLYLEIDKYIRTIGIHISPLQIQIINNNINDIAKRINICSELTKKTLKYIQYLPYDIKINHPQYNELTIPLTKKYFKNNLYPSTFTFGIKINSDELSIIQSKLTILTIETSFGSKLTILDNYISMIDDYSYIRISIGYEDTIERIINGLNELFSYI